MLLAVAEELTFTRAASRVHIVQLALPVSVHTLERELGARLIDRPISIRLRMVLTSAIRVHDRVTSNEPGSVRGADRVYRETGAHVWRERVSDHLPATEIHNGRKVEPSFVAKQLVSPINFRLGIGAVNCPRQLGHGLSAVCVACQEASTRRFPRPRGRSRRG
jgi:hypothetical protein